MFRRKDSGARLRLPRGCRRGASPPPADPDAIASRIAFGTPSRSPSGPGHAGVQEQVRLVKKIPQPRLRDETGKRNARPRSASSSASFRSVSASGPSPAIVSFDSRIPLVKNGQTPAGSSPFLSSGSAGTPGTVANGHPQAHSAAQTETGPAEYPCDGPGFSPPRQPSAVRFSAMACGAGQDERCQL